MACEELLGIRIREAAKEGNKRCFELHTERAQPGHGEEDGMFFTSKRIHEKLAAIKASGRLGFITLVDDARNRKIRFYDIYPYKDVEGKQPNGAGICEHAELCIFRTLEAEGKGHYGMRYHNSYIHPPRLQQEAKRLRVTIPTILADDIETEEGMDDGHARAVKLVKKSLERHTVSTYRELLEGVVARRPNANGF